MEPNLGDPMMRAASKPDIRLKRAHEPPSPDDGRRVLVDRLWPRGLRKADAAIDRWAKEIAPNTELRRWFGHDPDRWEEFRRRYRGELSAHSDLLAEFRSLALTLVYSARDEDHNDAVVLRDMLSQWERGTPSEQILYGTLRLPNDHARRAEGAGALG
jgi:uncharacterized protein YeaO (DUF488 family)